MADITHSITASRRAILGVALAAPAMAAISIPAMATALSDSDDWTSLVSQHRAARTEAQRLYDIWQEAEGRADDAVAHMVAPKEPKVGPIDTRRPFADIIADGRTPEWKASWARYEAERDAFNAQREAAIAAIVGDTEQNWNDADDAQQDLLESIRAFPVTSLAMLREKADTLERVYSSELDADDAEALIADIRRLAAREG